MKVPTSSVNITLGGWVELSIKGDHLSLRQMEKGGVGTIAEISLGKATNKRISDIQGYLERLKVHAS